MKPVFLAAVATAGCLGAFSFPARAADPVDWHKSALHSATPDGEVLHLNIGGGSKPNVLERWWHGKRCRWLDESGQMRPDDLRGDQVGDVLQVDIDGDGTYDGPDDMNVKWCDTDGDGIPDVQTIVKNPTHWGEAEHKNAGDPVYMIFLNHDQKGVLGWIDWDKFNFNCWAIRGCATGCLTTMATATSLKSTGRPTR